MHVRAVMPIMSAKQPDIFPHACVSSNKASRIFKHLQNSEHCRALCSVDCFHNLDHACTSFQLKIEGVIYIQREQRPLNQQLHPCKSKTILLILTMSHFMYIPLLLA